MKKVEIAWRDSHRFTYQMNPAEEANITTIHSVGYLVRKDDTQVVICQDEIEGDIRGVMAIPRENIIKITYIKETPPKESLSKN